MEDGSVFSRIDELVAEEHAILEREGSGNAREDDHRRLGDVQATLDQCWDLLRQRRARRDFHQPDDSAVRPEGTVEGYQQ